MRMVFSSPSALLPQESLEDTFEKFLEDTETSLECSFKEPMECSQEQQMLCGLFLWATFLKGKNKKISIQLNTQGLSSGSIQISGDLESRSLLSPRPQKKIIQLEKLAQLETPDGALAYYINALQKAYGFMTTFSLEHNNVMASPPPQKAPYTPLELSVLWKRS
jgi:hypothetical protein